MEKLISMTNFVLEQQNKSDSMGNSYWKCTRYANFLKQPLTLGMFVPCDKKGNVYVDYKTYQPKKGNICIPYEGLFEVSRKGKDVELLNEPQFWKDDQRFYNKRKYEEALKEYQETKDRVLFEVTKEFLESNIYDENGFFYTLEIVEDLIASHNNYNLVLTESAKKQILGL